jgi:hypothetical protein
MVEGGSETEGAIPASWDVQTHGLEQLEELNAMERNRDRSCVASSAIFAVASAILAVVFFQQEEHYLARSAIGALGLLTTGFWLLVAMRSHQFETLWRKKAESLEEKLGVDPQYRVWGERPKWLSSWQAMLVALGGFIAFWVVGTVFAVWMLMD